MAQTSSLIAPVQLVLHRVSCSNDTLPNAPKYYEMHQNMSLGSNGVDRVRSLRKIPMGLHGTKFFTSLTRFTLGVVTQPNSPKRPQIIRNTPKHEFRVQLGISGAFILKNFDAASWHEHVH